MNVQSPLFIGGVFAITLLVIALAAWVIGRRRSPASFIGSLVAIVVSTLLTTTTMALVVNVGGSWVRTTADVIGLFQSGFGGEQMSSAVDSAESASVDRRAGEGEDESLLPASVAPDSALKVDFQRDPETDELTAMVEGQESGLTRSVTIWVPQDFDPNSSTVYDVMIFNHGYPGTDKGPANALQIQQTYDDLVAKGAVRPMIFVTPDVSMEGAAPNCVDIEGQPKVETFITQDVVRVLRSSFPNLNTHREGWILSGISSGGYCAPVLAARHTNVFQGAISLGAYDAPQFGPLASSGPEVVRRFTISNMLSELTGPPVHMFFAGTKEELASLTLVESVTGKGRSEDQIVTHLDPTGGHSWTVWSAQMSLGIQWWSTDAMQIQSTRQAALGEPVTSSDAERLEKMEQALADAKAASNTELASVNYTPPAPFSLKGLGTVILSWVGAAALLGVSVWVGPQIGSVRSGSHRYADSSRRSRGVRLFAVRFALVALTSFVMSTAILLTVNYFESFYTSVSGLVADLKVFF